MTSLLGSRRVTTVSLVLIIVLTTAITSIALRRARSSGGFLLQISSSLVQYSRIIWIFLVGLAVG
jgi:hypothetical protein